MGLLLPVITVCIHKLTTAKSNNLNYCAPLADALLIGLKSRFSSQLEDPECVLASAFHPQFKLTWCRESLDENKIKEIKQKITSLINDRIENPQAQYMSAGSSTEEDDQTESFFGDLFKTHKKVNDAEELVKKIWIVHFLPLCLLPIHFRVNYLKNYL